MTERGKQMSNQSGPTGESAAGDEENYTATVRPATIGTADTGDHHDSYQQLEPYDSYLVPQDVFDM